MQELGPSDGKGERGERKGKMFRSPFKPRVPSQPQTGFSHTTVGGKEGKSGVWCRDWLADKTTLATIRWETVMISKSDPVWLSIVVYSHDFY